MSLNFLELFIIEKYGINCGIKVRHKNRDSPCYFLSSRGQKTKNITKIELKRLVLFTFLVSFFMAFLMQKQDHLLNLIILGVYAKSRTKYARISKQKLMWPNI